MSPEPGSDPTPVDLTIVRSVTGGDVVLEQSLFAAFFDSAETCLLQLSESWCSGKEESWRHHAHALKGTALNIGAVQLGQLARKAQDGAVSLPAAEKQQLLAALQPEYARVKGFLQQVHKG